LKQALGLVSLLFLLAAAAFGQSSSFFYIIPDRISFGTITIGQSASQNVSTYRSTDDGLVVSAVSSNPAFTVSPSSQVVGTDGATFTVRFQPSAGGSYSGTVTFSAPGAGVLGQIPVDGTAYAPFSVDPSTLTFDPLLVGQSSTKTFRILANPQAGSLAVTLRSLNPAAFSVTPTEFSSVTTSSPAVATVTFAPNAAGTLRGAILVAGGGASISVATEGEGAAFLLSESEIDLGGALVGCVNSRSFSVIAGGQFDFNIVPTTPGLPFSVEPASFSANETTPVTARFTPATPGTAQGIFRIFARSSGRILQQRDLPFSGVGVEPVAEPGSMNFGDVPMGTTSPPRSTVIVTTPPGAFQGAYSATSDNPAFRVLSTNTSGRVEVVFAPTVEGPANGIITIQVASQSDRNCGVAVQVPVQGAGTPAPLTLSPSSLDFGVVAIGQTSPAQEVLVTNQSATTFTGTVSSDNAVFRLDGTSSAAVAQAAISVPAGGSTRVPAVFEPATAGVVTGTITFSFSGTPAGSSDPVNLTRTVAARGEGIAANLSYTVVQAGTPAGVSPGGSVDFGPTGVGATNSVQFEVRNEGTTPATVDVVSASGGPFEATGFPALPTTIAPGASLAFTLNFRPTALTPFSGTLDVGFAEFELQGNGVLSGAEITGVNATIAPNSQPEIGIRLPAPAPQALNGTLTMNYTPAGSLRPDPAVRFETGGASAAFTVPEGRDAAVFSNNEATVGFQSGTVAASFVFSASLAASEADVTPSPAPSSTGSVAGGPPTISRVAVESVSGAGFTVVVVGFSPTREITQATFNFTGRTGVQVQPASVTPSGIADVFRNWFQSDASAAYGSMFTLTIPFTISGEANAIASVSATVSNAAGASPAASANLP
jgi:hypothetical protein